MKRYYIDVGPPPTLFAQVGAGKPKHLGKIDDTPAWRIGVAFAILKDALNDEDRARMLATRFTWRVMEDWQRTQPRSVSDATVMKTVEDIEQTAAEAVLLRRMIDRERMVPDIDRLPPGVEGSTPALRPNLPKKP